MQKRKHKTTTNCNNKSNKGKEITPSERARKPNANETNTDANTNTCQEIIK